VADEINRAIAFSLWAVGGGEKGGHYGGLKRATGVVTRWTWQRAQKQCDSDPSRTYHVVAVRQP
jgi:hypothetical protein